MRQLLRDLWPYIYAHRRQYSLAFLLLTYTNICMVITPIIVGTVTDLISAGSLTLGLLLRYVLALLALVLTCYGSNVLWDYFAFGTADRIGCELRHNLLRRYIQAPPAFFHRFDRAALLARSNSDVDTVVDLSGYGVLTFSDGLIYPLILIAIMFWRFPFWLTFASLVPALLVPLNIILMGKYISRRFAAFQESYEAMYSSVLEQVTGVRCCRAYRMEDYLSSQFDAAAEKNEELRFRHKSLRNLSSSLSRTLTFVSISMGFALSLYFIHEGQLSMGQVISFNIYHQLLIWPLYAFSDLVLMLQDTSSSFGRIQEALAPFPDEDRLKPGAAPGLARPAEAPLHLELCGLYFSYPEAKEPMLQDIHLDLAPGRQIGIVGRTGSGKTSLLRQFLFLYPSQPGQFLVNGQDLSLYDAEALRRQISYVPQEPALFSLSLRDNLRLGREELSDAELHRLLEIAAFDEEVQQFPEGLDTLLGEKGLNISGGQKQRLSIARALAKPAQLYILDDSLSALDGETERRILEQLPKALGQASCLISSHRLSAVQHCQEILVLDGGRVVERGSHSELMALNGWYCEQFQRQSDQFSEGGQENDPVQH